MKRTLIRWTSVLVAVVLLGLFVSLTPALANTPSAARLQSAATTEGTVTSDAKVRSAPSTSAPVQFMAVHGTVVNIYAQVQGDTAWAGNLWDRISPTNAAPLYIYAGLVQQINNGCDGCNTGGSGGTPPITSGKVMVVSISKQWLYAYENGKQVYDAPVTTAQPGLVTPTGTYHILSHLHPTTFYSPWPKGSPYYYDPTYINYAMAWRPDGYFLHDSYWRSTFGPGTNVPHHDPQHGWLTGTHGCITAPLDAIIWLYNWAPDGTTFIVQS